MCAEYMCMLQDSVYCPKCSSGHSFGMFQYSLCLHFWCCNRWQRHGATQDRYCQEPDNYWFGPTPEDKTTGDNSAAPADTAPASPAPAPAAAEAEGAALEDEPAAAAAAAPCSPAGKGKQRAGKGCYSGRAWFWLNQCAWIVVTACKPATATASPCNSQSLPPASREKQKANINMSSMCTSIVQSCIYIW